MRGVDVRLTTAAVYWKELVQGGGKGGVKNKLKDISGDREKRKYSMGAVEEAVYMTAAL